jgi:hypothetical protein
MASATCRLLFTRFTSQSKHAAYLQRHEPGRE